RKGSDVGLNFLFSWTVSFQAVKEIFLRINQYLLFVILAVVVLYFGRPILIPVIFAAMLAMLMAPVCRRIDRWGAHRAVSCTVCIVILAGFIAGVGIVVGAQASAFAKDFDQIKQKGSEMMEQAQTFVERKLGISPEKQKSVIREQTQGAEKAAGSAAAKILTAITSVVAGIALTLVFTFLFLFNKEKYEKFFLKIYADEEQTLVKKVVSQISHVSQQYLIGKVMSITIIAVLYSIGLSIVGIKNAILLAGIAALMTLIPYVGTVLGGAIPVLMALVTEDSFQPALYAALVMFAIQTIDNYFIEPNIVGGEVNLSAIASILSIIAGGLVWGVAGMILFLPMVGILKIICDHIEPLKPFGYVIGDPSGKKASAVGGWIKGRISALRGRK